MKRNGLKLSRFSGWIDRFVRSSEKLGIIDTFKVFILAPFRDGKLSVTLPNGRRFYFKGKSDRGVLNHFFKNGFYIQDNETLRVKNIVEAGAYIGGETARFLIHYPDAEIVAVEPAERNYALLTDNFGKLPNIRLIRGALWPVKANLKLVPGNSASGHRVAETEDPRDSVPAWSIRRIMDEMGWERIDILKMDIEGSEFEIFTRDFDDWIDKVNVIIFEVPDADRSRSTQAIYRALDRTGYDTFVCGENLVLIKSGLPWKLRVVPGFRDGPGRARAEISAIGKEEKTN